ncbi:TetR/AcrR family transcriptional regulator [Microbacterium sp. NPDC058062]|uniref:TetR/AcrR family transcriptional regulator n=1 Tax=Microbacterium sp. NPDC058062 TaxID=3346320 RepID=UPI0036DBF2CB
MDKSRSRRKRGSLSPEEIVAAAMSLLDSEGESALTFTRLGEELSASPTAFYRHFGSRAELVSEIADRLDALSLAGFEPTDDWRADLTELAWRAWRVALEHPAAAALSLGIITNGVEELRAVEAVLRALHVAGLRGRVAVVYYQAYANLVLSAAQSQAARLAAADNAGGPLRLVQAYSPADPNQFPFADSVRNELRRVDYEEVFATQLKMYVDALELVIAREGINAGPSPR